MLKISAAWVLSCALTITSAMAAEVVTTKAVNSSLQQVKFTTQKSRVSQIDDTSALHNAALREKTIVQNDSIEPTSITAKIGLLATALLCFVLRSSRRKV